MKKILSILLCLAMTAGMFSGCSDAHAPEAYEPTGNLEGAPLPGQEEQEEAPQEQVMSLAYYPEEDCNPLSSTDYTNRVLMPLIYQGLFSVGRDNEVIPILCKSYTMTSDMRTYEFELDPAATFSDGVPVTGEDVIASLQEARNNRYYGTRLRDVTSMYVTDAGTIKMTLSTAYSNLPILLDIPVVKKDQVEAEFPLGSGPYVWKGWGTRKYLQRRDNWWCKSEDLLVTAPEISLVNAESPASIRDAFEFFGVGVVCTDPGSDRYVEYRCDYELWDCETGIFVYLGVNSSSPVFKNKDVRQALCKGIDRDSLVDKYYRGFAMSATLPASPSSPYYSQALAKKYAYDPMFYQTATADLKGKTVKLLVNSFDSLRVKVAQEIGRMLNTSGLIVEVVALPHGMYQNALREGEFDLYLGQTKLSPNMDLSQFLSSNGTLNYGGVKDAGDLSLFKQALENQGNYYGLHQSIMDKGYLCPILFRNYAVYAARGLLTNLRPSRDNLFCYSVGRTQTDVYQIIQE